MKRLCLLFAVSMVFLFSLASNSMAWTLIYANDTNGVASYGSLQVLIDAVRAGKQIRFNVGAGDAVMDGQLVEIENNVVCAQNTSSVSIIWSGGVMKTQTDPFYAYYIVCTTGDVNISRWLVGTHTSAGVTQNKEPIKWFVN